jgi:osmotically-inducible protein OsmY
MKRLLRLTPFLLALPVFGVTPLSDKDVADNVEMRLAGAAELGTLTLRAAVTEGKAVLEGRVRLLSQSWHAVEVTAQVRGVRAIDNRLEVEPAGGSDVQIATAIRRRFEDRIALASAGLKVEVEEGRARISGSVKDARLRFQARAAAAETAGVMDVEDRITSPPASDEELLHAIERLLRPGSLVTVRGEIRPSVKEGIVTLEGVVPFLANRFAAERLVLGINGVRQVENRLEVVILPPFRSASDSGG